MTDVSILVESLDVKVVPAIGDAVVSARSKSSNGKVTKAQFVESEAFKTHTLHNREHIEKSASHWKMARPERPYIARVFLELLGKPVTKGRSVAHVLWDLSRESMPLLVPDDHTIDYSPLTTVMMQCFCGSHVEEVSEAFFWEAFRRMPTDVVIVRAIKRLASMSEDEAASRYPDGSNPVVVNFWVALMQGVKVLLLAHKILKSSDVNVVVECSYLTEFPVAFKKFNDSMALDADFWARKSIAKLPEMKEVDVSESVTVESDSDESSSTEDGDDDDESKGFDEGSDVNDDGDFNSTEDAAESEANGASENGGDDDDDDDDDESHPKKKARTVKGFRPRPEGSRTSSRLSQVAKVNLEDRDVSANDKNESDEEQDVDNDEKEDDDKTTHDAPKTDIASPSMDTSVVAAAAAT